MTTTLDVLLLESQSRAGDAASAALEAAGHRVHRCFDEPSYGFPCRGVLDARQCPIERPIDVALLVRRRVAPRPTPYEGGVRCAIRAGVPIVEHGADLYDPFAPWITSRIESTAEVVPGCVGAAQQALAPLGRAITDRIRALLDAAEIDPAAVHQTIDTNGLSMVVHLHLPAPVSRSLKQALAVRVLDAVRSHDRTLGSIDVAVHVPTETGGACGLE